MVKERKKLYLQYRRENFEQVYFNLDNGGFVVAHKKHGLGELKQNIIIAKILADLGEAIILLEDIPNFKSPDAKRNDLEWEFKTVSNAKNIVNALQLAIRKAKKQADNILIFINQPFTFRHIYKALELSIKNDQEKRVKRIDLLTKNGLSQYTRDDIKNGRHKR